MCSLGFVGAGGHHALWLHGLGSWARCVHVGLKFQPSRSSPCALARMRRMSMSRAWTEANSRPGNKAKAASTDGQLRRDVGLLSRPDGANRDTRLFPLRRVVS